MNEKFKRILFVFLAVLCIPEVFAGIKFGDAEINDNDEIVYTIRHELPGTMSYSSLFTATIKNGILGSEPKMITCFPEKMEMLNGGAFLPLRNSLAQHPYKRT